MNLIYKIFNLIKLNACFALLNLSSYAIIIRIKAFVFTDGPKWNQYLNSLKDESMIRDSNFCLDIYRMPDLIWKI